MRLRHLGIATVALPTAVVAWSVGAAHAQVDIVIPALVFESGEHEIGAADDDELELANMVQSAAKGITTVQEAPAIVTVVTDDEIRARGYQNMGQLIDSVPGWTRLSPYNNLFETVLTRGVGGSVLVLHDGVSAYDSFTNAPALGRTQTLENIKRVELITGPGGVLWGANSFLGLINIITKDARDVDGVEAGIAAADGNGDRRALRGYLMAGVPDLFGDRAQLFAHASFETFRGPGFEMPSLLTMAPPPQPNSDAIYGPLTRATPARSTIFSVDGKLSAGALSLTVQMPFVEHHRPLGIAGFVAREHWKEDSLELPGGGLACPFMEPYVIDSDRCLDKGRTARDNEYNLFDRYAIGEYRHRSADGTAGMTVKAYGLELHRDFVHLGGFAGVPLLTEGGLAISNSTTSYRAGTSLDADRSLTSTLRVLYGAEGFHEWAPRDVTRSRQGDGVEAEILAPLALERLPLPCPREPDPDQPGGVRIMPGCPLTYAFPANRTVFGVYVNPQWRPTRKLILDAGARLQVAPSALSLQPYDLIPIFSGALVYNFLPDWHGKLNYSEGFRPPLFNSTASNGEAVSLAGGPDLAVETAQALQAELNARLFRGDRRVRELTLRVDAAYTRVRNEIRIVAGRYENTADTNNYAGELLASLRLQGGHQLQLGYTYNRVTAADVGAQKGIPEHWFDLAGVFNVIADRLQVTTDLRVSGAVEDPNRLIEYRDLGYDDAGGVIDMRTNDAARLVVQPHELVMDRLPPSAILTVGVTLTPTPRLRLSAFAYNAFDARYYQPTGYIDYEPRLTFAPGPYEDFSARVSMSYDY